MSILMVPPTDQPSRLTLVSPEKRTYVDVAVRRPRFYLARAVDVVTPANRINLRKLGWTDYDGPENPEIPYSIAEGTPVDYDGAFSRIAEKVSVDVMREFLAKVVGAEEPELPPSAPEVLSFDVESIIDVETWTLKSLTRLLHTLDQNRNTQGKSKPMILSMIERIVPEGVVVSDAYAEKQFRENPSIV